MRSDKIKLFSKFNEDQLKKLGKKIEMPKMDEMLEALKNTISRKALAEDNML